MKRLLAALIFLAASVFVVPGTASAHSGCGVGWRPPVYNPGWGYAECSVLSAGESVRVEFKCATADNRFDPNGNVANGWFVGPWVSAANTWSYYSCNTAYPYVANIQYNLMLNGCDSCI